MTILVLDIGSSSARALLFDDQAEPIPSASVTQPHHMTTTPPGAATMDAADLQSRVEACIDRVLQHPAARNIQAVGIASYVGNMLGVDEKGKALTPIYSYADTRCAIDVEALKKVLDAEAVHQRTGCILHTAYQPGRLRWLSRTEPKSFAKVSRWIDFATYFYSQWFGASPASYSVASWSGMLNRRDLTWDSDLLKVLGLDSARLPELADYKAVRQGLTTEYAKRWPALKDTPFCLAVGDGAAANIGSGCADSSHIVLTVGTTAALRTVSEDQLPTVPDGLWSYRIDAAHHLIGGATSEGGSIFQWAKATLQLPDHAGIEAELSKREPDAHGLTFLPLLAGERSPGWSAHATGSVAGLRLSTTPLDILQAALEGVALRLSLIADQLMPLAGKKTTFIAGGGALVASPAWAQMIADALDAPLRITEDTEITARGAAILALHAVGKSSLTAHSPSIAHIVKPISAHVPVLRAARQRQMALYQKLVSDGL